MALLGVVVVVAFWARQSAPPATRQESGVVLQTLTGPVVHVVDGDTIDVRLDGRTVRVRYIGINTPETKHPEKGVEPFGPEADAANRRLVAGKTVRLELDVQPWDRYRGSSTPSSWLSSPSCSWPFSSWSARRGLPPAA
jgi:endonuclease YncB( thermonuclease family)